MDILKINQESYMQYSNDIERVMSNKEIALLEKHEELIGYPATKTYIKSCVSFFPTNNNFIIQAIKNKDTIENTLKFYDLGDIETAISKHYVYNKARPTPLQVVAMITGEKDGDLKKRYVEDMRTATYSKRGNNANEEYYKQLASQALKRYSYDIYRKQINHKQRTALDDMMVTYIFFQAYILAYLKNGIINNSKNKGLSSHFNHISTIQDEPVNYLVNSLTNYFKSDEYVQEVIMNNNIKDNIPDAFKEYLAEPQFMEEEEQDIKKEQDINDTFKPLTINIDKKNKENYFQNKRKITL